jgi:hypothetical protein
VTGRRVLAAVGIGLAGELSALGLLATGGWLLLSASLRPPILLLSIAIGAVQLFSLLRGTARYAERLASHDLGLRVQAGLRGWLYRRLEHLVPAGLPGGDRGDLLARLVRDTEEAQDLVVRTAVPVLAAALTWAAAVVTAAALLPAAGRRARWPAARAWPGWPGPGPGRCGPGGSARSSSACWSSWPWARPRCCRGSRTRPGGCRSAGRRLTGWPTSAGYPCQ